MEPHLDDDILDAFKEFAPSSAYLMGFDDYAGMLFIPSQENIDAALEGPRIEGQG